jgi:beta-carotene 15,15'-dioxygenase
MAWPSLTALLILYLGAPHGALDVEVARNRWQLHSRKELGRFLAAYVLVIALVAIGWWTLPSVTLVSFLLLSAHHFGGDWGERPGPSAARIAEIMRVAAPALAVGASLVALNRLQSQPSDTVEYVTVLVAAAILPPLTFFLLYFCLLHSVRHLADVARELAPTRPAVLMRIGAPYCLVAVGGAATAVLGFGQLNVGPALLSAVFASLAALTVPHILPVERPWVAP